MTSEFALAADAALWSGRTGTTAGQVHATGVVYGVADPAVTVASGARRVGVT